MAGGRVAPLTSNLNWLANDGATPNKVDVKLGADGRINIYNNAGSVDVIADIVGYYADHNHDDRYYTRAEVDAAVQAAVTQASHTVHHDTYSPLSIITYSGSITGVGSCIQTGGVERRAVDGSRRRQADLDRSRRHR